MKKVLKNNAIKNEFSYFMLKDVVTFLFVISLIKQIKWHVFNFEIDDRSKLSL